MATEEQIKELAYFLWEQEDKQDGNDVDQYFRAKKILEEREARQADFPPALELVQQAMEIEPTSARKPAVRRTTRRRTKKE